MKFAVLALIAGASAKNFPKLDSFHAHCQFETTVADKTCAETYSTLSGVLNTFNGPADKDPARGFYTKA